LTIGVPIVHAAPDGGAASTVPGPIGLGEGTGQDGQSGDRGGDGKGQTGGGEDPGFHDGMRRALPLQEGRSRHFAGTVFVSQEFSIHPGDFLKPPI
jgi:hypothetical protein